MNSNFFFDKKNLKIRDIFSKVHAKDNFLISNIKPLHLASKKDLTFFDSIRYKSNAEKTKAGACITTEKLEVYSNNSREKYYNTFTREKHINRMLEVFGKVFMQKK